MNPIKESSVKEDILSVIGDGDILFIVPPFVTTRTPILGPHILQTIAQEQGWKADILYLNLLLASRIRLDLYESVSYGQPFRMLGERLFARSAYGLPPLGNVPERCLNPTKSVFGDRQCYPFEEFEYKYYEISDFDLDTFLKIEEMCTAFIKDVSQTIASLKYKIVGCSTNWEQNNCCVALINGIKEKSPETITLLGGSNCEADMAEGMASLSDSIDYIFSGESEETFADFLKGYTAGDLPVQRIIEGQPVEDLDDIPLPKYESYFAQIECFFEKNPPTPIQIGYETSRGCWWGKCSFCGLNGKRGRFRQKAFKKVMSELEEINTRYPDHRIIAIDKVMPRSYQQELLPLLCEKEGMSPMTYEQRPDLTLKELVNLKKANITIIKPGIEAFSTRLLQLMNKGITARQNILLLRHAKSLGILVSWNLLWGFPGDKTEHYEETLNVLPLLRHLQPPVVFRHLSLDRFCAYCENPEAYHIKALRPWAVYHMIYPEWANVAKLAYRFIGEYPCAAHENPELIREITHEIEFWKKSWKNSTLIMIPFADSFIIHDSRNIPGTGQNHILEASQAKEIMSCGVYQESEHQTWAVEHKLGVVLDSWYVPLVTAKPELLLEFEERHYNELRI